MIRVTGLPPPDGARWEWPHLQRTYFVQCTEGETMEQVMAHPDVPKVGWTLPEAGLRCVSLHVEEAGNGWRIEAHFTNPGSELAAADVEIENEIAQRAGMMHRVLNDYTDDCSRLIYADWIGENGNQAQEWLIRLQIAALSLPRCPSPNERFAQESDYCSCARHVNRREQSDLLRTHRRKLLRVPSHLHGLFRHVRFRRGFIAELHYVDTEMWSRHGAEVLRHWPIELVKFNQPMPLGAHSFEIINPWAGLWVGLVEYGPPVREDLGILPNPQFYSSRDDLIEDFPRLAAQFWDMYDVGSTPAWRVRGLVSMPDPTLRD
jgi:uncharacterized protein (TIGR02996 family)